MAKSDSRWDVLAALRFILATLVVITHSGIVDRSSIIFLYFGGQTGFAAVFVFFMVSGYSIAASLEKERSGYFWRRVRRIYPTFLFAIAFCFAITSFGPLTLPYGQVVEPQPSSVYLGHIFMLQGIFTGLLPQDAPLYSLAIEWWLYMIAPTLMLVGNRYAIIIGLASFCFMCYYFYAFGNGSPDAGHLNILLYSWSWLFGFAFYRSQSPLNTLLLIAPPLVLFGHILNLDYAPLVVGVGSATLLLADKIRISSLHVKSVMRWLGDVSYPLYLFHLPLLYLLATKTSVKNGNLLVLVVLVTVSIGYIVSSFAWDKFNVFYARNILLRERPI